MHMTKWHPFPYDNAAFVFTGDDLLANWVRLHSGDRVPFPDTEWLQDMLETHPGAASEDFDGDLSRLASALQDAWRAFHCGDFERAVKTGVQCGPLGHAAANKAVGIYASHLEPDDEKQQACFMTAARRAEHASEILPTDANTHYFHAFNLGRYSQSVSVLDALRQGIGGKIQQNLLCTLELEPDHGEAHTALGMYHAEIINKVGKMIGGMTYDASTDKALAHFERALELVPESPIAHVEYGNGLYLLFGERRLDDVTDLYVKASGMHPRDAMEKLDIEAAAAELE